MTYDTSRCGQTPGPDPDPVRCSYDYTLHNHLTFGHLNPYSLTFIDR